MCPAAHVSRSPTGRSRVHIPYDCHRATTPSPASHRSPPTQMSTIPARKSNVIRPPSRLVSSFMVVPRDVRCYMSICPRLPPTVLWTGVYKPLHWLTGRSVIRRVCQHLYQRSSASATVLVHVKHLRSCILHHSSRQPRAAPRQA